MADNNLTQHAIQEMIRAMDFDGYLLTRFDISIVDKIDETQIQTAALMYSNGRFSIKVNEKFFAALTDAERIAVLKHEAAHFVMKHFARRNGRDPEGWNIAADAAINQNISNLPENRVKIPSTWKAHEPTEVYYDLIEKRKQQQQSQNGQPGKGGQPGGKGQPGGQPSPGNNGGGQVDKQWDTVMDTSLNSDNGESMASEITREVVKERLAAGEQSSKLRGLHAGNLGDYIEELTGTPITNWKVAMQNFPATLKQAQSHYTLKRPDRRALSPYGKRREFEPSIILCIDTSESVSEQMLGDFLSQANALLRYTEELRVIFADAKVQDSFKYKAGMVERLRKVSGRGGTDFDPAIIYINKELARDFDGVIYLTDGYCPVPQTRCKLPVLWVVQGNETFEGKPKVNVPVKQRY